MSVPLVSIIIPCFNAGKYVTEAIQSALDQTYPNCEVIVIDDGSTDGSLEIIKSFGDRIRWESGPNRGGCAARNRGIILAKGVYLKFFDADDVLLSDALERQIKVAELLPDGCITYGDTLDHQTREAVFKKVRLSEQNSTEENVAELLLGDLLTTTPLHKRSFLLEDGMFNTSLRRGQEWNLHVRLALKGFRFCYHPCPVFLYRRHDDPERVTNRGNLHSVFLFNLRKILMTLAEVEATFGFVLPKVVQEAVYKRLLKLGIEFVGKAEKASVSAIFRRAREYHRFNLSVQSVLHGVSPMILGNYYGSITAEKFLGYVRKTRNRLAGKR